MNDSRRVNHNLFILARSVKAYKAWNVSFGKEGANATGNKLNLVIMARAFTNVSKINVPKTLAANGIGSIILLKEDDSLLGLDEFLRDYPERLKSEFY